MEAARSRARQGPDGAVAQPLARRRTWGDNGWCVLYGAGMTLEPVSEVSIEAASDNPRELGTVAELRELMVTCDLTGLQWTPRVVVQHRVIPHSHPVLTLNTRVTGDSLLATYLHEQMHWWTADHPGFGLAISDTRSEWAVVADNAAGGSRDEHSTRLHLIVCHLERRAMECVVGRSRTAAVLHDQIRDRIYSWVYGQIEIHDRWLDQVCSERDLWPARIAP